MPCRVCYLANSPWLTPAGLGQLGMSYVDVGALQGWCHLQPSDLLQDAGREAAALRRQLAAAGLTPVALNGGLPAPEMDQWRALVALAREFAIPVIHLAAPAERE